MEGTNNINGVINFTLEGLNELIQTAEKMKKDANHSKMENFTRIVKGVAKKYGSTNWIDREDLEQDLWVKVLTLIDENGGIENVNESMVSRVCWNKAVDAYRYSRRRYESTCEFIENMDSDDDSDDGVKDNGPDYFDCKNNSIPNIQDIIFFKEALDLFPSGSRERKYVLMKLVSDGALPLSYVDKEDMLILEIPNGDTEADYIACLGYKSHCPGSWTCKKRDMRQVVDKFLRG